MLIVKQRPILTTFSVFFTSLHRQIHIKKQCNNNYTRSISTLFTGKCWALIDINPKPCEKYLGAAAR